MSSISLKRCGCSFGDAWIVASRIAASSAIPREKCGIFCLRMSADLSSLFFRIEFAAVDRKHLQMADPSLTRSPKKWARAHGPLNEAGHNGAQVVVCSTRSQCDLQTSQGCSGTPHSSSGHHPDHRRRKQPLQRKRTGVGRRTGEAEAKRQKSKRAEKTALF